MTRWESPVASTDEDEDLGLISNSLTCCLPRKTTEQAFVCPTKQPSFRFLKTRGNGITKGFAGEGADADTDPK